MGCPVFKNFEVETSTEKSDELNEQDDDREMDFVWLDDELVKG